MPSTLRFTLPFTSPYDWPSLAGFLARRSIDGVETVTVESYERTFRVPTADGDVAGWVQVAPARDADALAVTLSASAAPVLEAIGTRLAHVFDTTCDPAIVAARLGELAEPSPGLRLPGAFDGFELAVRAILGQQITVSAARTLAGRFARAFGGGVEASPSGLATTFPRPQDVAGRQAAEIGELGVVRVRSGAILEIARRMADGALVLAPDADAEAAMATLRAVPGVGEWTVQYIAMRALRATDAFPHTDHGVRKAMGITADRAVLAQAEAWRPWRAYAVMHLWRSLG